MAKLKYGIVGCPVGHSLSPAMQAEAFSASGIDAEYLTYDIEPGALEGFLGSCAAAGLSGLNVTIPHKIKAREYLERAGSVDDAAAKLGAVNTIKVVGGRLRGFNTDGPGFYRSLVEDLRFEPEGKRVFILGAGGAASAVAMYLGNGPSRISVFDVDPAKADALRERYCGYFDAKRFTAVSRAALVKGAIADSDLLVNTTPVGMGEDDPSPVDRALLHRGLFVYDLVYNRPFTRLVKEANSMKLHAVTGLGMLLYQGAIAFEIWTGLKAPVGRMRRALRAALRGA